MHEISMTIDAGHATLFQKCVRGAPILARRTDCVGIMAAAARDAVLGAQFGLNRLREFRPMRLPGFLILEIVRQLREDVTHARADMGIRLEEPVGCRNVAVGTSRDYTLAVAAVL